MGGLGGAPGLGDPFTFDYDPDYNGQGQANRAGQGQVKKAANPSAGPTVM